MHRGRRHLLLCFLFIALLLVGLLAPQWLDEARDYEDYNRHGQPHIPLDGILKLWPRRERPPAFAPTFSIFKFDARYAPWDVDSIVKPETAYFRDFYEQLQMVRVFGIGANLTDATSVQSLMHGSSFIPTRPPPPTLIGEDGQGAAAHRANWEVRGILQETQLLQRLHGNSVEYIDASLLKASLSSLNGESEAALVSRVVRKKRWPSYDIPRATATQAPSHGWETFYIALNLYQSEAIITFLTGALVAFIEDEIAPFYNVSTSVVVSIFSNIPSPSAAKPKTGEEDDDDNLTDLLVRHTLLPALHAAGVTTIFATTNGTCLGSSYRQSFHERIEWMACLRNKAMEPLYEHGMRLFSSLSAFSTESPRDLQQQQLPSEDKLVILFFNDVFFKARDVTTLLESRMEPGIAAQAVPDGALRASVVPVKDDGDEAGQPELGGDHQEQQQRRELKELTRVERAGTTFDLACGMDFYYTFYDTWVSRDRFGRAFLPHIPYTDDSLTLESFQRIADARSRSTRTTSASHEKDKMEGERAGREGKEEEDGEDARRYAVPVKCCWNGLAAIRGSYFLSPMTPARRKAFPSSSSLSSFSHEKWGKNGTGTPPAGGDSGKDGERNAQAYYRTYNFWGDDAAAATADPNASPFLLSSLLERGRDLPLFNATAVSTPESHFPLLSFTRPSGAVYDLVRDQAGAIHALRHMYSRIVLRRMLSIRSAWEKERNSETDGEGDTREESANSWPDDWEVAQRLKRNDPLVALPKACAGASEGESDVDGGGMCKLSSTLPGILRELAHHMESNAAGLLPGETFGMPFNTDSLIYKHHRKETDNGVEGEINTAKYAPPSHQQQPVDSLYYRVRYPALRFRHPLIPSYGATVEHSDQGGEALSVSEDVCFSSECLLICEDLLQAALLQHNRPPVILMNPNVKVAYEHDHFTRVTSSWIYNSGTAYRWAQRVRRLERWLLAWWYVLSSYSPSSSATQGWNWNPLTFLQRTTTKTTALRATDKGDGVGDLTEVDRLLRATAKQDKEKDQHERDTGQHDDVNGENDKDNFANVGALVGKATNARDDWTRGKPDRMMDLYLHDSLHTATRGGRKGGEEKAEQPSPASASTTRVQVRVNVSQLTTMMCYLPDAVPFGGIVSCLYRIATLAVVAALLVGLVLDVHEGIKAKMRATAVAAAAAGDESSASSSERWWWWWWRGGCDDPPLRRRFKDEDRLGESNDDDEGDGGKCGDAGLRAATLLPSSQLTLEEYYWVRCASVMRWIAWRVRRMITHPSWSLSVRIAAVFAPAKGNRSSAWKSRCLALSALPVALLVACAQLIVKMYNTCWVPCCGRVGYYCHCCCGSRSCCCCCCRGEGNPHFKAVAGGESHEGREKDKWTTAAYETGFDGAIEAESGGGFGCGKMQHQNPQEQQQQWYYRTTSAAGLQPMVGYGVRLDGGYELLSTVTAATAAAAAANASMSSFVGSNDGLFVAGATASPITPAAVAAVSVAPISPSTPLLPQPSLHHVRPRTVRAAAAAAAALSLPANVKTRVAEEEVQASVGSSTPSRVWSL